MGNYSRAFFVTVTEGIRDSETCTQSSTHTHCLLSFKCRTVVWVWPPFLTLACVLPLCLPPPRCFLCYLSINVLNFLFYFLFISACPSSSFEILYSPPPPILNLQAWDTDGWKNEQLSNYSQPLIILLFQLLCSICLHYNNNSPSASSSHNGTLSRWVQEDERWQEAR